MAFKDKAIKVYWKMMESPKTKQLGKKFDSYWRYMSGEAGETTRKALNKTIASIRKDKRFTSKARAFPLYKHERYRKAYKNVLKADAKRVGAISATSLAAVGAIRGVQEITK